MAKASVPTEEQKVLGELVKLLKDSGVSLQEVIDNIKASKEQKKVSLTFKNGAWQDDAGNVYEGPPIVDGDSKEQKQIKKNVASGLRAGKFFARQSVATCMTEAASAMGDLSRTQAPRTGKCIHRPKNS